MYVLLKGVYKQRVSGITGFINRNWIQNTLTAVFQSIYILFVQKWSFKVAFSISLRLVCSKVIFESDFFSQFTFCLFKNDLWKLLFQSVYILFLQNLCSKVAFSVNWHLVQKWWLKVAVSVSLRPVCSEMIFESCGWIPRVLLTSDVYLFFLS